jgi:hypothetical protein
MAGDRLEDNLNPVGRLYYAGSTMVCVPTSLSQPASRNRDTFQYGAGGTAVSTRLR